MRPIIVVSEQRCKETALGVAHTIATKMSFEIAEHHLPELASIDAIVEEEDGAMLIMGLDSGSHVRQYLKQLHDLRIPYVFVKEGMDFRIERIALPVTFLMEEKEKGPYTASIARHFSAEVTIYKPKDYGSKAERNIGAITTLLDSFDIKSEITEGRKDSFKIEMEALLQGEKNHQLLVVGASRDYGLDDIIFGTKEEKIVKKSSIPVMLVNPRGDLYALCD